MKKLLEIKSKIEKISKTINTVEEAWDYLLETGIIKDEQTLQVVTNINGYSLKTLEDVLYATEGYRSFDQLLDEDDDEEDEDILNIEDVQNEDGLGFLDK